MIYALISAWRVSRNEDTAFHRGTTVSVDGYKAVVVQSVRDV
jgi:hypothetical protein